MPYHSRLNRILTTFLLAAALHMSGCNQQKSSDSDTDQPKGRTLEYTRTVTFLDAGGEPIKSIEVAVADEESERNMGLMDVNNLPADKGMLFIFESNSPRSFWMANTPLSLDIIFVNLENRIVRIHHSTQPFSDKSLPSEKPAKYVVETNAGFCVSNDIQEGMMVLFENSKSSQGDP